MRSSLLTSSVEETTVCYWRSIVQTYIQGQSRQQNLKVFATKSLMCFWNMRWKKINSDWIARKYWFISCKMLLHWITGVVPATLPGMGSSRSRRFVAVAKIPVVVLKSQSWSSAPSTLTVCFWEFLPLPSAVRGASTRCLSPLSVSHPILSLLLLSLLFCSLLPGLRELPICPSGTH